MNQYKGYPIKTNLIKYGKEIDSADTVGRIVQTVSAQLTTKVLI